MGQCLLCPCWGCRQGTAAAGGRVRTQRDPGPARKPKNAQCVAAVPAGHGHSRGWDPRAVAPGALSSHPALCWLILPVLLVIPRTQLLDPAQLSFCTAAPAALGPSLPRVCTLGPVLAISACNHSCYTMKGCARRLNCCFNRLALSNVHAHKTFRHLFPCPGAAGEQLECMQGSSVCPH